MYHYPFHIKLYSHHQRSKFSFHFLSEEKHCRLPTGLQGRLVESDGQSTNMFRHNKTYELVCDQGYISAGGPKLIKCHHGTLSHHPECIGKLSGFLAKDNELGALAVLQQYH